MEFSVTLAFTLKPGSALNDVDDAIHNLEEKALGAPGFKDFDIYLDLGTSIFQERWHSVEAYTTHLASVKELYLSFLHSVTVCKVDIVGTKEALTDTEVQKIFDSFNPKFNELNLS